LGPTGSRSRCRILRRKPRLSARWRYRRSSRRQSPEGGSPGSSHGGGIGHHRSSQGIDFSSRRTSRRGHARRRGRRRSWGTCPLSDRRDRRGMNGLLRRRRGGHPACRRRSYSEHRPLQNCLGSRGPGAWRSCRRSRPRYPGGGVHHEHGALELGGCRALDVESALLAGSHTIVVLRPAVRAKHSDLPPVSRRRSTRRPSVQPRGLMLKSDGELRWPLSVPSADPAEATSPATRSGLEGVNLGKPLVIAQ